MTVDLPNYRIIEKLGVGAQTRIFRARCMRTGKDYAIKTVKIVNPEDASFIDLLRAEHAIGSSVDHPVIRKVYELRMLRRRLRVHGAILFMEYVPGISLADREFQRPIDEILQVFSEVAQGLNAMHLAGYVHADLKPTNILVTPDGAVKLIDLGQSAKSNQAKKRVQGTIDYMAPEQVQRGTLDRRTDVFGLGAALHKLLTGKPVRTEMNQTITLHSSSLVGKRIDEVHDSSTHELPAAVVRLMEDCCQYDPADRIQDMGAVIQRIELARASLAKVAAAEAPVHDDEDGSAADVGLRFSDDEDPIADALHPSEDGLDPPA